MSWLARSIANTLKLDDGGDEDESVVSKPKPKPESESESESGDPKHHLLQEDDGSSPTSLSRGVKEDLSELTKTLTRQFWGVASFLAPPPQQSQTEPDMGDKPETDQDGIAGIRSDFAEIGGKFKTGISMLSNNINVSEFTKIASNFLQLESDEEEDKGNRDGSRRGAVGVTEEVVGFAEHIAMHPETWLDFPLLENDSDDDDDFDMSYAQQEHALAVEHLAPRLAAVRNELCPGCISENHFWKIYFVLLHPRLDEQDAECLSTPQILKVRALLAQELKNRTATKLEEENRSMGQKESAHNEESLSVPSAVTSENVPDKASVSETGISSAPAASETVKHPVKSNEIPVIDKSVIKQEDSSEAKEQSCTNDLGERDEDDGDDWLNEDDSEIGASSGIPIQVGNDDDVSFSDLEDDEGDAPSSFRKTNDSSDSQDWIQLRKSSSDSSKDGENKQSGNKTVNVYDTKEPNDWLDIDDIDAA